LNQEEVKRVRLQYIDIEGDMLDEEYRLQNKGNNKVLKAGTNKVRFVLKLLAGVNSYTMSSHS